MITTIRAVREYRKNFTRRGVWLIVRRRWRELLLHPDDELANATRLTTGAFT